MTLLWVVGASSLICIGVGATCYFIGANKGWQDALDYFAKRAAQANPEDDAA